MCRNIRMLFNFEPPASEEEIEAAAVQFVRKVSGSTRPSQQNQPSFDRAVREVTRATRRLLGELSTTAPAKSRAREAEKAKERHRQRFGSAGSS